MQPSTILSQNEIDALNQAPVSRTAKEAKVSASTVYAALRGKFVGAETADKLRALAGKTNGSSPKVSPKGKGRPGEAILTTDERRQLRQILKAEPQYKFSERIGVAQNSIRRAREGKGIRDATAATLRSALAAGERPGPGAVTFEHLFDARATPAPRVIRHVRKAPKQGRDLASFLEGQIIMAEFLSMSIRDFMNGTETQK